MCLTSQNPPAPASAADAAAMVTAGLGWLATADAGSLTTAEQAGVLRALGRAESMHTAAHARVLSAFQAQDGCRDDGHGSAKMWLRWQTRITRGAATDTMGWMRRLNAHPAIAGALARGEISPSWARQLCKWSDLLPAEARGQADVVLLGAVAKGWELVEVGALAEELQRRCARPDTDPDDGFSDRSLRLETTFGGAGKLDGDLTASCAAALSAVLDSLGKRAGPEDLRSTWQRRHDALEEACRRLIAAGGLPDRAGQPTQIMVHMDLGRLRGLPGAPGAEAAWAGAATAPPGAECDAALVPVVTGRVDPDVLDRLANALLHPATGQPGPATQPGATPTSPAATQPCSAADEARRARALRAARRIVLAAAADLLSGPGGLAAYLRTRLAPGTVASVSLPLDIGAITDTIPVHLRRAVAVRDRHCRFPGCDQPIAACQPHHIIPRSQGGPTCLTNLLALCTFHHLIAIHRWGWGIALHPDGTVTATSPDGRVLHSHGPPVQAA
jgi:Domain of unknown function (DUF222)